MTLQQAIQANVRIEPGQKIATFGGWCRHDRVLLGGRLIGIIQTRRGRNRTEVITISNSVYMIGYNVGWLIRQKATLYGANTASARSV